MVNKSLPDCRRAKENDMDDYWEELLEFHAAESDTPEPADDATEL